MYVYNFYFFHVMLCYILVFISMLMEYVQNNYFFLAQCVGNFTKNGGFITSPFYPKNYDDDMTCEYVITAPVGYRVSLLFSHMDLGSQECCEYDKIIVSVLICRAQIVLEIF